MDGEYGRTQQGYSRLAEMILTSTIVMFGLMYLHSAVCLTRAALHTMELPPGATASRCNCLSIFRCYLRFIARAIVMTCR